MTEPGRYATQERDWVRDAAAHDQECDRFQDELREPRIVEAFEQHGIYDDALGREY